MQDVINRLTYPIAVNSIFVATIWLLFFILFLTFSFCEWKRSIKGLTVKEINLGFSDLNNAYNITREAIIGSDKSSHRLAALSYLLAALTALASLIFSYIVR